MVGVVDVDEVGEAPAGTTEPPAAAEVMVAELGMVEAGVEVTMVVAVPVTSTVEEDTLAEEQEEQDGGKPNNRCWSRSNLKPLT